MMTGASSYELPQQPSSRCWPAQMLQHACLKVSGLYEGGNTINTPVSSDDITEIKDGQSCVPGKVYKLECNTCECGSNNELICTKVACLKNRAITKLAGNLKSRKAINAGDIGKSVQLPTLPKNKKCTPGKVYQDGCDTCVCNSERVPMCAKKGCRSKLSVLKNSSMLKLSDVRPEVTEDEAKKLTKLPNFASRCEPGKTFRVDCNYCVCLYNHILVCDTTLCLSVEDMNRIQAKKSSGKPCKNDNDIKKSTCVKCSCVKAKSECKPVSDCIPESIIESRRIHGKLDKHNPSVALHLEKKETCIPGAVYK
ncbi:hypothetical protein evm_004511 [Chilo suppressalis]|nr:hypothetical protein evm_004511 [Chilo suppressalis]